MLPGFLIHGGWQAKLPSPDPDNGVNDQSNDEHYNQHSYSYTSAKYITDQFTALEKDQYPTEQ